MDARIGIVLLFVLGAGWVCDARRISAAKTYEVTVVLTDVSGAEILIQEQQKEIQVSDEVNKKTQVCTLCEEFVTEAINYIAENKTQTEVIDFLHQTCSRVPSFEQQVSSVQPQDFCKKVNLCQGMAIISSETREDSCGICHRAVSELLVKLKDPDTQLEIIELLLKACNSMDSYAQKCKRMVFEYGPLVLTNAEQFLETTDVCTMLHACNSPKQASMVIKADS